jgi:hypothetical protein
MPIRFSAQPLTSLGMFAYAQSAKGRFELGLALGRGIIFNSVLQRRREGGDIAKHA